MLVVSILLIFFLNQQFITQGTVVDYLYRERKGKIKRRKRLEKVEKNKTNYITTK